MEKILMRPEWKPEQKDFLRQNPELAVRIESYLSSLDRKIANLEEQKAEHRRKHPIFYFFRDLMVTAYNIINIINR